MGRDILADQIPRATKVSAQVYCRDRIFFPYGSYYLHHLSVCSDYWVSNDIDG